MVYIHVYGFSFFSYCSPDSLPQRGTERNPKKEREQAKAKRATTEGVREE